MKKLKEIKLLSILFYKNFMRSRSGKILFYVLPIIFIFLSSLAITGKEVESGFMVITYSITYVVILFLSLFGSAELIISEIKENTIQFLFTKPLKEEKIILSKWISINLASLTTLMIYSFTFHIISLLIFKKYLLNLDISFITLFFMSLLYSSFSLLLTLLSPSLASPFLILVFGTGLIGWLLKLVLNSKPYTLIGLISKKLLSLFLYILFYIFPIQEKLVLHPSEVLWNKIFWQKYLPHFFYFLFTTAFYLILSIYIFKLKRKAYYKSF